ncbi:hypothetical protein [Anabaena azotica]|uniref:Uncharacterized protein n=1 Tax=Anabaena azotica FACHB-119 TaxID=947527 RepID=A0ABR8D879_9NOST|nr:hypothetical protein [Anabaena azotica]MBD2503146.1 hypothetical protein [Anabaena azotica FACHB-119]
MHLNCGYSPTHLSAFSPPLMFVYLKCPADGLHPIGFTPHEGHFLE